MKINLFKILIKNVFLVILMSLSQNSFGQECTNMQTATGSSIHVHSGQVYCVTDGYTGSLSIEQGGVLKICGNFESRGAFILRGVVKVATGANFQMVVAPHGPGTILYNQDQSCTMCEDPVINTSNATICAGESHTFDAGVHPSVKWFYGGQQVGTGRYYTASNAGQYTITAEDGSCSTTKQVHLTVNSLPNVTASASPNEICLGDQTMLIATGAANYTWDNNVVNGQVFNPTSTTTYTVTGTDGNGCKDSASVDVVVNPIFTHVFEATICDGNDYTWDGVDYSEAGEYVRNYSTVNGCDSIVTLTLNVNLKPEVNIDDAVKCSSMVAILNAGNSGSTYIWNTGSTDQEIRPFDTGVYWVSVTNEFGCSSTDTAEVTNHPDPVVDLGEDVEICDGETYTLDASGDYFWRYTWWHNGSIVDGPAFNDTHVVSESGEYVIALRDSNFCSTTDTIQVTVHALPTVTASASSAVVCDGESVTLTGGGASVYAWDNGVVDGAFFVPSSTTTYTVTGTDANGCENTASVEVVVNELPTVTAAASSAAVCDGESVTLTGGGASVYAWDNGVVDGASFVPSSTTTYTVTGTDGNGCKDSASVEVVVNELPTVTAAASSAAVCDGESVTLTGGGASVYAWDNGVVDGASFVPSSTTTYTVTGTDGNGCENTASVEVVVNANPVVDLGGATFLCSGSYTFDAENPGSTYLWNTGATSSTLTVSQEGNYSVTVTSPEGCSSVGQGSIVQSYAGSFTDKTDYLKTYGSLALYGGNYILSDDVAGSVDVSYLHSNKSVLVLQDLSYRGSIDVQPGSTLIICGDVTLEDDIYSSQGFELKSGATLKVFGKLTIENGALERLQGNVVVMQGAEIVNLDGVYYGSGLNVTYVGDVNCNAFVSANILTNNANIISSGAVSDCSRLSCPVNNCGSQEAVVESAEDTEPMNFEVEDLSTTTEFNIYPNPANDVLNVNYSNVDEESVTIQLVNAYGQTVLTESNSKVGSLVTVSLNVEGLQPGLYTLVKHTSNSFESLKVIIQ